MKQLKSPLEKEHAFFIRNFKRWLKEGHNGQEVLIKGTKRIGFFNSLEEAMTVGYEKFGVDQCFYVKMVTPTANDPVLITRLLGV